MSEKVKIEIQKRKISEIQFRKDLYARIEPDPKLINYYTENIDEIINNKAFIHISQSNILIDGYHRLKALETKHGKEYEIDCYVHLTDNEDHIELESYSSNTSHGKKTNKEENKRNIQRLYAKGHKVENIYKKLSISKDFVYGCTKKQREDEKKELTEQTLKLYLRAWNSQQDIANQLNINRNTIRPIIDGIGEFFENRQNTNSSKKSIKNQSSFKKEVISRKAGQIGKNWNLTSEDENYSKERPFRYNIWNTGKGNETSHFGSFPQIFMENLLYYHTKPLDIIFDPFAGEGTTVDICKKWMRRYLCYDIKVKPGREEDIKQHDIIQGLPEDFSKPKNKPDLVFLDPPYWILAKDKYSKENKTEEDSDSEQSKNDFGNMTLDEFRIAMKNLINELKQKKINRIAYLIRPIWITETETWEWIDPMFEFYVNLQSKYKVETRYVIPYSTEQYNATMVNKAKKANKPLILNRELTIFKLKENG